MDIQTFINWKRFSCVKVPYTFWYFTEDGLIILILKVFKSTKVFSSRLTKGTINAKWVKYRIVLICPNSINGVGDAHYMFST